MNSRELVLAHLEGRPVDRLPFMPITMMFAAEHVGVPYGEYALDHRVLAEAQIKTAHDYGSDHVSVISDPAREAADCGATIHYFDDQPPSIDEKNALLAEKSHFSFLEFPDPMAGGRMTDRVEGVRLLHSEVGNEKIVEGWVEGPIAEAADLRGINRIMLDFYEDPAFVVELFEFIIEMETRFAKAQVEAGADIIGIGDAAASLIGPKFYQEYVWPFEERLVKAIHQMGADVRLHICGKTTRHLEGMGKLKCNIVDLDYMVDMAEGRDKMGPKQVLLGNIDPVSVLKNGTPEQITKELEKCYRATAPRYIVSAGCEVPRGTPPENMVAMRKFAESAIANHGGSLQLSSN
ncbi:MAG: uroporphyrinogen decarboxylase family protein [Candidatus Omnitrophica bacterium]|nr:uroporphyrinogen decarboxylase family protein [Candidatus Omnitrophota bacterium]MCB9768338.1 uroporphyrinogen decarboxylase family protein [Candidatus Omnitrophota bacterium]